MSSTILADIGDLDLDRQSGQSLRWQLVLQFRDMVQQGRVKAGSRLPSTRQMADELGVARKTVVEVYDQLIAEGYFNARRGSGTFVSAVENLSTIAPQDFVDSDWFPELETVYPLSPGRMDPNLFPRTQWVRAASRGQRLLSPESMFNPPNGGCMKLRVAIAEHVWAMRGIQCAPEQVIVTSGLQESLRLICRAVLGPGKRMITEDPGYKIVDEVLEQNDLSAEYSSVDEDGLNYETALSSKKSIDAIFVASTRQYPLGYQLSARRRRGLINWNSLCEGFVIEDDYDCEFRFEGPRRQAIFAMDQGRRTFYLGSLSKTIFPRLRISFLIAPKSQVKHLIARQNFDGSNASISAQAALAEFMISGEYSKHLRYMRRVYMARYNSLFEAFKDRLGDYMIPIPVDGGFHFAASFRNAETMKRSDTDIVADCHDAGLGVLALSRFSTLEENKIQGLVIGFAGDDEATNLSALERLAAIVQP